MNGQATSSICNTTRSPVNCEHKESEPTEWRQGAVDMTFYGDENHEYTLPRTEKFLEFRTDNSGKNYWGNVPAGEVTRQQQIVINRVEEQVIKAKNYDQVMFERGNTASFTFTPVDTHATPCHTGMFPRPMKLGEDLIFMVMTLVLLLEVMD